MAREPIRFTVMSLALFFALPGPSFAQQFFLNNGCYFKLFGANLMLNASLNNNGTIITNGSTSIRLTGNWHNDGNFGSSGETIAFDGLEQQTISGASSHEFHDVLITNQAGVSAMENIRLNGVLMLAVSNPNDTTGALDMRGNILIMGGTARNEGPGDVSGIVSRSEFMANTEYTFGHPFTAMAFSDAGTIPSEVSVKTMPGVQPGWRKVALNRIYEIIRIDGSGSTVALKLHYLDSEVNNNPESEIVAWDCHSTPGPVVVEALPKAGNSEAENWVSTTYLPIEHFASEFGERSWTLSSSVYITLAGGKGWRMLSAPNPTNYSELLDELITQGIPGSSYPLKQPNFFWYDETDSLTTNMSWRIPSDMTDQTISGRGLYIYVFDSLSGSYSDTLPKIITATGNAYFPDEGSFTFGGQNQPVTYSPEALQEYPADPEDTVYYDIYSGNAGWNLIGNPTQYTLDWDAAGWTKTNIDNSIYIWDPTTGEFKVWNGIAGSLGNGLISPFQAFWVKANDYGPLLSFTDNVLTSGGIYYGGDPEEEKREAGTAANTISLTLNAGHLESHAFICFSENGVTGPDIQDAYRLDPLANTSLELFTLSSIQHNMPLVINNLPMNWQSDMLVPLYLSAKKDGKKIGGTFTLAWEMPADWPSDWSVILQDTRKKTAIPMLSHNTYTIELVQDKSIEDPVQNGIVPGLQEFPVSPVSRECRMKSFMEPPPLVIIFSKSGSLDSTLYFNLEPRFLASYPNPFREGTNLRITIPATCKASVQICDMYGKTVHAFEEETFDTGLHHLYWHSGDIAPGLYFACLKTDDAMDVIKLIVATE